MKKVIVYVVGVLVVVFVAMQLVPVNMENPPVKAAFEGTDAEMEVLRRSCYDCHSNETVWPWYSRVAPFSWFVAHHVEEGRVRLNFSEWGSYSPQRQAHAAMESYEEAHEGGMPLGSYLWLHPEAALSEADQKVLAGWVESFASNVSASDSGGEKAGAEDR